MDDNSSGSANFAPLGEVEIEGAGDIFAACAMIRTRASNSGLIILQFAHDVEAALASVPVMTPGGWNGIGSDNPQKRARRVARHLYLSAEAMRTVAESSAKFPPAYLKAFSDVIQRRRRSTFDPKAGL